jgi:hypothetical protein
MDTWSEAGDDIGGGIVGPLPPLPQQTQITAHFSPAKKTTANRNLIQKIETILASYELQEKYSTKFTLHTLSVIETLIKRKPEFFRMVESTLVRNVNDNKIRSNDVPYLIAIISQLYSLLTSLKIDADAGESVADTCGYILKFIFSVAIRENLVKIEDETSSTLLLLCFDNIIEACIKLVKLKPATVAQVAPPLLSIKTTVIDPKLEKKSGCCR